MRHCSRQKNDHQCKLLCAWPSTSILHRVRSCITTVGVHDAANTCNLHKGMPLNWGMGGNSMACPNASGLSAVSAGGATGDTLTTFNPLNFIIYIHAYLHTTSSVYSDWPSSALLQWCRKSEDNSVVKFAPSPCSLPSRHAPPSPHAGGGAGTHKHNCTEHAALAPLEFRCLHVANHCAYLHW